MSIPNIALYMIHHGCKTDFITSSKVIQDFDLTLDQWGISHVCAIDFDMDRN